MRRTRILVCVRHILAEILYHQLFGLSLHICANKAGEVEVRSSIEVELVLDHLMHRVCGSTVLRDPKLWNFLPGIVARAVRSDMARCTLVSSLDVCRVLLELFDELVDVDL